MQKNNASTDRNVLTQTPNFGIQGIIRKLTNVEKCDTNCESNTAESERSSNIKDIGEVREKLKIQNYLFYNNRELSIEIVVTLTKCETKFKNT